MLLNIAGFFLEDPNLVISHCFSKTLFAFWSLSENTDQTRFSLHLFGKETRQSASKHVLSTVVHCSHVINMRSFNTCLFAAVRFFNRLNCIKYFLQLTVSKKLPRNKSV
jgi:hypothetical protein